MRNAEFLNEEAKREGKNAKNCWDKGKAENKRNRNYGTVERWNAEAF